MILKTSELFTAVLPEKENEEKRHRLYYCTTIRYCNYHIQNGSKIVKVQNDKYRPGRLVFCFLWDDVCDRNAKQWEAGDREKYI